MSIHGIDTNGIVTAVSDLLKMDFDDDEDWEDEV
jgi:transketolase